MRALYSRLKKQDSSRQHFRSIVQQRSKSRSVNMDGTNFLRMVLNFLSKNEVVTAACFALYARCESRPSCVFFCVL